MRERCRQTLNAVDRQADYDRKYDMRRCVVKNRLTDLNDHLFSQLERLGVEGLSSEEIALEVKRTEAIVRVADKIVDNARLQLDAQTLVAEHRDLFVVGAIGLPMLAASSESKA